jgi:hypothetical protein
MNKTESANITLDQGLNKISFEDDFRQQCILQKNNSTLENKIWFGVDKDIIGKTVNVRMHLTQEQVRSLLPHLQKFAETGELL